MAEHWFLLSVAAVVGASGAVAIALSALRFREAPLDEMPAVDLPQVFEAGRVELVRLMPATPLAPPAVERWEAIRDYLIDDAEMRALVEPLYQGPPEN